MRIGNSGTGTFNLSGTGLVDGIGNNDDVRLGADASGVGTVNQSGGSTWDNNTKHLYLGVDATSEGTYNLSGGVLTNLNVIYIGHGGKGTVVQTGGTLTAAGNVRMAVVAGSVGSYEISGGTLTCTTLRNPVAGTSTFSVIGSSATINVGWYYESIAGSTLRVKPDATALSVINSPGTCRLRGTLEVDLSDYDGIGPLTMISYGNLDGTFAATNILTAGCTADVDYSNGTVRLINITGCLPKGTVVSVR